MHARVADERKLSDIVNIHIKLETSKLFFFIIKPLDQNHDKFGIQMCRVEIMKKFV